jgi:8-oxo-dGTP pyrophosphatase MutT (NUDIX family)
MSPGAPNPDITEIDRVEIAIEPFSWAFTADRRDDIDRHFARLRRERPGVWNGRVVLLNRYAIEDGALRGACFETDYASFCAWRDWDFPDSSVNNTFAAAAVRGADGGYLVGEMAHDTANAGSLYFPCGTPEPGDVTSGGALDLAGNLRREFLEETGLDGGAFEAEPGWRLVRDRNYMALLKHLTARQSAGELRDRIMRHIAREERPELADIRIVRGPADLDPRMPRFVVAFLEEIWRQ